MEKWKPSYSLDDIKAAFAAGKAELKVTPKRDALKLGFDEDAIVATIQAIKISDFDKSMTSYGNHKIWQDGSCPRSWCKSCGSITVCGGLAGCFRLPRRAG